MAKQVAAAWWEAPLRFGVRKLLHFTTHIYFSSIEVRGLRNVQRLAGLSTTTSPPTAAGATTTGNTNTTTGNTTATTTAGAIFAGNHPSGLVDPMVIMSALPGVPMSSVAKFSLFRAPFIKYFLRAMRAVPVAQPYDPGLPPDAQATAEERRAMNRDMFTIVQRRLTEEQMSIVIFPEGTCHSTPQIKQMRAGTARMALKVAAAGGPRVPIVPVGLSYSVPSGSAFRAKVLIDFGKPIEVTDEILAQYTSGDPELAAEVEDRLMKRVERHLRHVTIRVPNWTSELDDLCRREEGLGAPAYEMEMSTRLRREQSVLAEDAWGVPASVRRAIPKAMHDIPKRGAPEAERRPRQRVSVSVADVRDGDGRTQTFYSRTERESSGDARKRKELQADGGADKAPKIPDVLRRQAARAAFFGLQGFHSAPRDWEFVNAMHLARHIYKPEGVKLTLAQYASLTRNFIRIVLARLPDPKVRQLWQRLEEYQSQLNALGVTDSYVAKFIAMDADGDGVVSRQEQVRAELAAMLRTNRVDVLKSVFLVPLGLFGSVVHAPVAALAYFLGAKMGVSEASDGGAPGDGMDRSVEATMRMVGGFVGIGALYPAIGLLTHVFTPYSPLAVVAVVAASGYAAVLRQPVPDMLREVRASIRMHAQQKSASPPPPPASNNSNSHHETTPSASSSASTSFGRPEWLVGLSAQRTELQQGLRAFADEHASEDMRGWWRAPERYVAKVKQVQRDEELRALAKRQWVTAEMIEQANFLEFHVPLRRNVRSPLERAVLTSFMEEGNSKALLWIPGRNDSFYHVHILDRLLATGFDVHALDLRRCGRAKVATDGVTETTPELLGHDSYDFGEYNEEIDAVLKFLKSPQPAAAGTAAPRNIEHGGCGKVYDKIVCYAHSTGGLVAASYGARHGDDPGAWRGAIDGFIFNSPFFDWNVPWYQGLLARHINLGTGDRQNPGVLKRDLLLSEGGKRSEYSMKLFESYGFPTPKLKSLNELHVTAGWTAAVTRVQEALVGGRLRLPPHKPALVLSTMADEVLNQESISNRTPFLSSLPIHGEGELRTGNNNSAAGGAGRGGGAGGGGGGGGGKEGYGAAAGGAGALDHPLKRPIWADGVVERQIGSSEDHPSAHDVLAAPSMLRVDEALKHVERWLKTHFPE